MLNIYVSFDAPTGSILNDMKNKKIIHELTILRRGEVRDTIAVIMDRKIDAANIGPTIQKGKSRSRMEAQKKALSSIFSLLGFTFLFTSIGANANVIDNNTAFPPLPSSAYYTADYASDGADYGRDHHAYPDRPQSHCLSGHSGYVNGVLVNNIAYFSSRNGQPNNGGIGLTFSNCTRTNPCGYSDFSQTGINRLNNLLPNTVMWFNGGFYGSNYVDMGRIELNPGQSLHSRSADYRLPAGSENRSAFRDNFILNGNNTLESIAAISRERGTPVTIRNAPSRVISSLIGDPYTRLGTGIDLRFPSLIDDCDIFAREVGVSMDLYNRPGSTTIKNSRINVTIPSGYGYGVFMHDASPSFTSIENTTISLGLLDEGHATGIYVSTSDEVHINHLKLNVIAQGSNSRTYGIMFTGGVGGQVNNSEVHVTAPGGAIALSAHHRANYPTLLTANNSLLSANGTPGQIAESSSPARVVISNSTCFINNQGVSCP